jgi:hypothetical protein
LLLLARWPGVWLLGKGPGSAEPSDSSSDAALLCLSCLPCLSGGGGGGRGDGSVILWERTTLVLGGGALGLADALPESAMI